MIKTLLCAFIFAFSFPCFAQYGYDYDSYKWLSIDTQYAFFDDLVQNSSNPTLELETLLNINVNLRFYRSISLDISKGVASSWGYTGLGFRIDLPGVFFVNGRPNDFTKKHKKRNWNSYLHFSKLLATEENSEASFVCDRIGFGLDSFLVKGLYLNTELNIFSYRGNQFLSPVIGMGYEF